MYKVHSINSEYKVGFEKTPFVSLLQVRIFTESERKLYKKAQNTK